MSTNIYKAPESHVEDDSSNEVDNIKIYSPNQVACGTIGGPVGLIYFLWANFSSLKKEDEKNKTLIFGGIFIVLLIIALPLLPDDFPSMPFTIAYIMVAKLVSEQFQMTKVDIAESNCHDFYSNWRVLGIGLLCFVASIVLIVGPLILLE